MQPKNPLAGPGSHGKSLNIADIASSGHRSKYEPQAPELTLFDLACVESCEGIHDSSADSPDSVEAWPWPVTTNFN